MLNVYSLESILNRKKIEIMDLMFKMNTCGSEIPGLSSPCTEQIMLSRQANKQTLSQPSNINSQFKNGGKI